MSFKPDSEELPTFVRAFETYSLVPEDVPQADRKQVAEVIEMMNDFAGYFVSSINSRTYRFESVVDRYFASDYVEIVDLAVGNLDSTRKFFDLLAEMVSFHNAEFKPMRLRYPVVQILSETAAVAFVVAKMDIVFDQGAQLAGESRSTCVVTKAIDGWKFRHNCEQVRLAPSRGGERYLAQFPAV